MSKKKNPAKETSEVEAVETAAEAPEETTADCVQATEAEAADPMQLALDEANAKTAEYLALADSTDDALKSGVEMVLKQMTEAYGKINVKPINRQGEKFDPNLENAILQGTEDEGEPGTVCQVLQKGYMIGDKVLRHAMVKVVPE